MNSIDEEIRDVFAAFGQAIFVAQKLEGELTNALADLELLPNHLKFHENQAAWEMAVDQFFLACSRKTMGQLLTQLSAHQDFYEPIQDCLKAALRARNYLSHHFLVEESELALNSEGRKRMLHGLQEKQAVFRATAIKLEQAIEPIRSQFIPALKFQTSFQEYLRKESSDLLEFD